MWSRDLLSVGHQDGSVSVFNMRGECTLFCEASTSVTEPIVRLASRKKRIIVGTTATGHILQWLIDSPNKGPTILYFLSASILSYRISLSLARLL